jgi:AraC-like DNA-binding protein
LDLEGIEKQVIMKLYIKNMVCDRCKSIVRTELNRIGVRFLSVEMGEAVVKEDLSVNQLALLSIALKQSGLELLKKDKYDIVENLKKAIVDLEHFSDEDLNTCYSDFISNRLQVSFISLNTLFSEIEGITIEKYIVNHKIELIKELLIYNKLNLSEIAHQMHYSSTEKMASQFKDITGLAPLHFRQLWLRGNHHPEYN